MAEDPPPSKWQKLSSLVDFPDLLWAKIFSYLPLKERFQISAVCRQWRDISRIPWSDIKRLDMSHIPSAKINSILSLTSVVSEITLRKRRIVLDVYAMPPILTSLESLKLYDVCFAPQDAYPPNQAMQNREHLLSEYSCGRFPKLSELVLHNVTSVDLQGNPASGMRAISEDANPDRALLRFPNSPWHSLRRLQLTYGWLSPIGSANLIAAMNELEDLECLYLGSDGLVFSAMTTNMDTLLTNLLRSLEKMQNLRELCLTDLRFTLSSTHNVFDRACFAFTNFNQIAALACEKLHKLEVFIFAAGGDITHTGISRLLTDHSTLKILVICGESAELSGMEAAAEMLNANFNAVVLPRRRRSIPSPADQAPLPCLQVFVGGSFLPFVRFTPSDAAVFTEIDCPMPQFLAKPQVADVFKEVWAAKMIRHGAENGGAPWDCPNWFHRFHSTNSLQFHNGN